MASAVVSAWFRLPPRVKSHRSTTCFNYLRLITTTSSMCQHTGEISAVVDVSRNDGVLRRDLIDSWPLGSVVTQGCHASVAAIWSFKDDPVTLQYCDPAHIDSMHKVTLEVKGETQMMNLTEKLR
ncbi:unnamed protein product [Eruca vesicaria subsp. sativa]|uniref:peptidyl-tRNA hydrolase n=1 Tax=Eruca vesicaria subsp. sativa TaxID=29727 RepID=A0ABC8IUL2_ERUVS|nr:unnamed protein product [Eruca vesicaria subsp. sativa]